MGTRFKKRTCLGLDQGTRSSPSVGTYVLVQESTGDFRLCEMDDEKKELEAHLAIMVPLVLRSTLC